MKRALIISAVLVFVATLALSGSKPVTCDSVKDLAISAVDDESNYRNHGQYVRAAANYLNTSWPNISEACHDCIMAGFAQSDPAGASCNFPSDGSSN